MSIVVLEYDVIRRIRVIAISVYFTNDRFSVK